MTPLTFTRHTDDLIGPTWILSGPNGAIVFSPIGIDVHSPAPVYGRGNKPHSDNCPATKAVCWADGSSLEGAKLRERWENSGHDEAVIRAELERWYNELLSSPAPVDEGSRASGDGVGSVWGGRSDLAATGAGEQVAVSPAPVADQWPLPVEPERSGGVVNVPGNRWIAPADEPAPVAAQPLEISDELVELVAEAEYEADSDALEGYDTPWLAALSALRNEYVRRARAGLEVAIPLLRRRWEAERAEEPAWGSGPLVDHNPETADLEAGQ